MREIRDDRIDELEAVAMEGVRELRAFFAYQGTDVRHFQKARLATGMISAYARLRSSETNRIALEFAAGRQAPRLGAAPPAAVEGVATPSKRSRGSR